MTSPNVYRYRYQGDDIRRVYGASRYTGSVRYRDGVAESRGPDREYVERRGHVRIGTADVVDVNDYSRERATRQGDRERIEVYRPKVTREATGRSMRPDRVTRSERAPSIDSRYLDQRMRLEAKDDDRMREQMGREKSDVRGSDGLQRPMPDGRPQVRQQPVPQVTPREGERSTPDMKHSDRQPRNRQEVKPSVPSQVPTRESQPAVKQPPRQREARPEPPKDAQRPEPKPRDRD